MKKIKEFSKVIDPWDQFKDNAGVQGSKVATLNSYRKALFFSKFPRIELKKKNNIVVMGTGLYKRLDLDLKNKTHVVISARDILRDFSLIHKLIKSFTFDIAIYSKIYNQIFNEASDENYQNVRNSLIRIKPKVLILKSTIDPINRVWAFWAKKLNIKVICLQHGIFSSKSNPKILERDIVDFYITLGMKQSKMISPIIPSYKHINKYEQGYYSNNFKNKKNISICFIGSDHERYSSAGIKNKEKVLNIYIELINFLNARVDYKYKYFYKMHPSETRNNNKILPLVETIKESDFNNVDIFFGVASSLIVKLASFHKCSIQLRSDSLPLDNYEELGYCGSIDIKEIKNNGLSSILKKNRVFPCVKEKDLSQIIRSLKLL